MSEALLQRAEALGVELGYHDAFGEWTDTPIGVVSEIVERMGQPATGIVVLAQGDSLDLDASYEIRLEQGDVVSGNGRLPLDLPLGYHQVEYSGETKALIVTPHGCVAPSIGRSWGWSLQVYALHSSQSCGIGDLRDLRDFGRMAASMGASFIQTNPLNAARTNGEMQPSPYYPTSRLFMNPIYLSFESKNPAFGADERIDRDSVYGEKLRLARAAFEEFDGSPEFDKFKSARGERLKAFARMTQPDEPDVAEWVQWKLDEQLAAVGECIAWINDLALGFDPTGVDATFFGDVVVSGMSAGAPPDAFNRDGQDWSFPPFDPWGLRASGYEAFIETLKASMRHAAGIRIDHVMGLFRLFWIPEGRLPIEGAYVRYPYQDLLGLVALESVRNNCFVIGEDLGTVEPRVKSELAARSILGYRVMWFDRETREYDPLTMATLSTHDLPTFMGAWSGDDLQQQQRAGLVPDRDSLTELHGFLRKFGDEAEEARDRLYAELARSPSVLVAGSLEDALMSRVRPNVPGTTSPENWSSRLPVSLDALPKHEGFRGLSRLLDEGRS